MIILIPMAGEGQRFQEKGYKLSKPLIPVTDWKTGSKTSMVIAAINDLTFRNSKSQIIIVDRLHHKAQGIENEIQTHYPQSQFITLDKVTEGQAATCLKAKSSIPPEEELLIGACDSGMILDEAEFQKQKEKADVLLFAFRNYPCVEDNPQAYGWIHLKDQKNVDYVSVKKALSPTPIKDFAIIGAFWFKKAQYFFEAIETMIKNNDKVNNEYYIDQAINYAIKKGLQVHIHEPKRYFNWGIPEAYEEYEATFSYWKHFLEKENGH